MSVRMLGRQRDDVVTAGLIDRLGSRSAELREVAALGLGFTEPKTAVEPLIRTLRDATPGVRANSAWALGRIDDGRALRPLMDLLRDDDARVREASAVAVGRIDSLTSVDALVRVVREDASAQVRRAAAWALGQIEARSAVDVLIAVLRQDADSRVREMVQRGLVEEVQALWEAGRLGVQAREALGYKQLARWLEAGAYPGRLPDAIEQIKIETRRFAKKQRTWLRRLRSFPHAMWISGGSQDTRLSAQDIVSACLKHHASGL
jgi:HEAT repeat protein